MAKKLAILSVAIICAFVVFVLVPKREFSIPIFPQPSAELPIVYDDVSDGGSSAATVRRVDSVLEFQCTLGKDTSKAAWCGLIWTLDSKNWLLVDSIVMDVFSKRFADDIPSSFKRNRITKRGKSHRTSFLGILCSRILVSAKSSGQGTGPTA